MENEEVKRRVLDIFVDKIYIYEDGMTITFHFLDDKQELSYEDIIEMIDNHAYLMECVNEPESHIVRSEGLQIMVDLFLPSTFS